MDIISIVRRLAKDRRGVTALEYGILAGVLGLCLINIFQKLGTKLSGLFSTIGASL